RLVPGGRRPSRPRGPELARDRRTSGRPRLLSLAPGGGAAGAAPIAGRPARSAAPVTLRGVSPEPGCDSRRDVQQKPAAEHQSLRAAYEIASRQRTRRGAIAYCIVAIALLLAAVPIDDVRFLPDISAVLLPIRLGGSAALIALLALLVSRRGQTSPRRLALLAP